jgi:hypothetical protein
LANAGVEVVRLPYRAPNLNAFIERFIRSIKEECLDRVIPLGEAHLRELIREYMAHYHVERRIKVSAVRLASRPTVTRPIARGSGGSDSLDCSTITTEKPRETRAIQ